MNSDKIYSRSNWEDFPREELLAAVDRTPRGTVSLLFGRVPVHQVQPSWRGVRVELHQEVDLYPDDQGGVYVIAPMRSGFGARLFGRKWRVLGVLPLHVAEVILIKYAEGAILRARIVDMLPPRLRANGPDMGFYVSIRCRS
ncbi:MAG: hypothetical protein K9G72_21335 [Rhodobacteraceae bacterium]|nr:hypothetical protein [Paracoccaceae bacterium]